MLERALLYARGCCRKGSQVVWVLLFSFLPFRYFIPSNLFPQMFSQCPVDDI